MRGRLARWHRVSWPNPEQASFLRWHDSPSLCMGVGCCLGIGLHSSSTLWIPHMVRTRRSMSRRKPLQLHDSPPRKDADPALVRRVLAGLSRSKGFLFLTPTFDPGDWKDPREVLRILRKRCLMHHLMQGLQDRTDGQIGRYIRFLGGRSDLYPDPHVVAECSTSSPSGDVQIRKAIRAARRYWSRYGDLDVRTGTNSHESRQRLVGYVAEHCQDKWWFDWAKKEVGWRPKSVLGSDARPSLGIERWEPLVDSRVRGASHRCDVRVGS